MQGPKMVMLINAYCGLVRKYSYPIIGLVNKQNRKGVAIDKYYNAKGSRKHGVCNNRQRILETGLQFAQHNVFNLSKDYSKLDCMQFVVLDPTKHAVYTNNSPRLKS